MNNKVLKDYNCLKVLATILVVFAHVTRMYTRSGIIEPINKSIGLDYITKYVYSFHMPLFVAISGAIYYFLRRECNKYNDSSRFIKGKIKRLIVPYLIFGILYVAPVMVLFDFTTSSYLGYVYRGIILSTNSRHLWYILMLFNVFIIIYFLEKYIDKIPIFFNILFVVVIYLISFRVTSKFQINNTLRYFIYFYFGYLFQGSKEYLRTKLKFDFKTMLVSLIFNIIILYLSLTLNINSHIINLLSVCSATVGMITWYSITNLIVDRKITNNNIYKELEKNSFGIYLFHPMIIYILFYIFGGKDINPYVLTTIVFIVSLVMSNYLTVLIRKIKLGFIMGE